MKERRHHTGTRFLVTIAWVAAMGTAATNAQTGQNAEYFEIKRLVESLAGAIDDMGDSKLRDARSTLLRKGPSAVPVLKTLFLESRDDRFRTTAIGTMFLLQNGPAIAVQTVETELNKEPQDWHGHQWIFLSLNHLEEIDPEKARWAARRALLADDDRFLRASALGRLKRIGRLEDVSTLEAFIARRQLEPPAGELREGIVRQAERTIKEIRKRESGNPITPTAPAIEPKQASHVPTSTTATVVPAKQAAAESTETNQPSRWLLMVAIIATLAFAAFAIRRR